MLSEALSLPGMQRVVELPLASPLQLTKSWIPLASVTVLGATSFTRSVPAAPPARVAPALVADRGVVGSALGHSATLLVTENLTGTSTVWVVVPVAVTAENTLMLPSVNPVVAVPETAPVARTLYVATNKAGRVKDSVTAPVSSATTSELRSQVRPWSSLTYRCTDSPGCQLPPVRLTSPPGG